MYSSSRHGSASVRAPTCRTRIACNNIDVESAIRWPWSHDFVSDEPTIKISCHYGMRSGILGKHIGSFQESLFRTSGNGSWCSSSKSKSVDGKSCISKFLFRMHPITKEGGMNLRYSFLSGIAKGPMNVVGGGILN